MRESKSTAGGVLAGVLFLTIPTPGTFAGDDISGGTLRIIGFSRDSRYIAFRDDEDKDSGANAASFPSRIMIVEAAAGTITETTQIGEMVLDEDPRSREKLSSRRSRSGGPTPSWRNRDSSVRPGRFSPTRHTPLRTVET